MLWPLDVSARSGSASAQMASDRAVAEAEAMIKDSGRHDPPDLKLVQHAIDRLHRALSYDPENDSAYVDLGFCYGILNDAPTAVEMYTKATRINPSGANFKELADIYLRVGDPEEALMAANAGIVKDPRNARLYNAKGMALNELGRKREAVAALQHAVMLDPSFEVARKNLQALNRGSLKSTIRRQ